MSWRSSKTRQEMPSSACRFCFHYCTPHRSSTRSYDLGFLLMTGPLWLLLDVHLQNSSTSTTFLDLFCYRSSRSTLALFFNQIMQTTYGTSCYELSYSLSNTFLASQITRFFSHRVCLGYDGKATACTRECWWPSPSNGKNLAINAAGDHPGALSVYAMPCGSLHPG